MKIIIGLAFVYLVACSSNSKNSESAQELAREKFQSPHTGAVFAGDYPDPSIIRVGQQYWATATTSRWAPAFTLFTSDDLANWKMFGSVFQTKPEWTDGNYWAPEIARIASTFYVYYAAKNKSTGGMCIGVATSSKVQGPYKDHGPMICQQVGSIDAMPVVDEKGNRYLFWKEDGNSQGKPTPIWLQKLSADGLKLVGAATETIRNDSPWEGNLVEGPFVFKRKNFWYMFYAASACCTRECNSQVGVARAQSLLGKWEKNPANPIMKGNDTWKCPGHGSIVQTLEGQDVFMYHAYHVRDSVYVGRQALSDVVEWGEDGWPKINSGKGPSAHELGFLGKPLKNVEHRFVDDFNQDKLLPDWRWPQDLQPKIKIDDGVLAISGPGASEDPMKAVLGKVTTTSNYQATAKIGVAKMPPQSFAGLAAFGSWDNATGLSVSDKKVYLWSKNRGKLTILSSVEVSSSEFLYIRLTASEGHLFKFEYSIDQQTWIPVGNEVDGFDFSPWDSGIRVALTSGGPTGSAGVFDEFQLYPLVGASK